MVKKVWCLNCNRLACKITKRHNWKKERITCSGGCQLIERANEAPQVKCLCGLRIILLEAQV